ncbi:MAG: tetratricopeptide repeat protein [Phycisphaerales bacterium]
MMRPWPGLLLLTFGMMLMLAGGCRHFGGVRSGNPTYSPEERAARNAEVEEKLTDARAASEQGDYDLAIALFREILSKNPTVTTAYLGIADIYMETSDFNQAESNYSRAAQLEPRNFDAQYGHGFALQMLNRFVEAIRAYHRALVIRPDSPQANLNMATTYLQMGDAQAARNFAEKAVELDPESGPARVNLGAVYDKLGMHAEAIDTYRVAMELMDPTPELVLNLVQTLRTSERYNEMINAAETLNRREPNANAFEAIGYGHFKLRDYDRSMAAYQRAVELDDTNWPSWNGIGCNAVNRWLLSKKRDADAKRTAGEALRKSLKINPRQENVLQLVSTYQL